MSLNLSQKRAKTQSKIGELPPNSNLALFYNALSVVNLNDSVAYLQKILIVNHNLAKIEVKKGNNSKLVCGQSPLSNLTCIIDALPFCKV